MFEPSEEQKRARQKVVHDSINAALDLILYAVDSKELATIMFYRSCMMLQALHSMGAMTVKDVDIFTKEAMKDILVPLPQNELPKIRILDPMTGEIHGAVSSRMS